MDERALTETENPPTLTPLQCHILALALNGLTNREIGERLGGTPGMVGTQIGRIVERLGLTRRSDILAAAKGHRRDAIPWTSRAAP